MRHVATSARGGLVSARATARVNIALAKYWGKSDVRRNLPAVPSVSLTLEELVTQTEVSFVPDLGRDRLVLDGQVAGWRQQERVVALPDRVRHMAGFAHKAIVNSDNRFPTAAGLASSDSGLAALAAAATKRSRKTSPYYGAWLSSAPGWSETVKQAIRKRDLESRGVAMEQSTLAFHCCAITSQPSTLRVLSILISAPGAEILVEGS